MSTLRHAFERLLRGADGSARAPSERGSALIEVVVSSVLVVIVAGGVFTAFDTATRSTAEERHRARAHSIAEADLSRMRTMRISDLSNLSETRTETQDGTPYTVESDAEFQTDSTGTASCDEGTASADYIRITSTVTWPSIGSRPPVVSQSIVAPPNGSVSASSGALAIGVENAANEGIPGIGLTGSGQGSFSGVTGPNGCAIFGNLPAGEYTVTVSGVGSGLIDRDGNEPGPIQTSVVAESTNTVVLQYDDPGAAVVRFQTRAYGTNEQVDSTTDSVIAFNNGMSAAKAFGDPGTPVAEITGTPLFPFSSPYSVYAGTCEGDNPNPGGVAGSPGEDAIATVDVPAGGAAPAETIQLPALHVTVYTGADTSSSPAAGATVKVRDTQCGDFLRTFTTNAQGQLDDPGLPYSVYNVCAHGDVGGSTQSRTTGTADSPADPDVTNLTTGTVLNLFLSGTGSQPSECA
jgi:Tfp pilus assembly protein PilV